MEWRSVESQNYLQRNLRQLIGVYACSVPSRLKSLLHLSHHPLFGRILRNEASPVYINEVYEMTTNGDKALDKGRKSRKPFTVIKQIVLEQNDATVLVCSGRRESEKRREINTYHILLLTKWEEGREGEEGRPVIPLNYYYDKRPKEVLESLNGFHRTPRTMAWQMVDLTPQFPTLEIRSESSAICWTRLHLSRFLYANKIKSNK